MRFFFLLLIVPFYLFAEWDSLFPSDEDPALFHHVHVISGQLCLAVEDTVLQGAYPFSLTRTYSSSGALQRGQIHKNVRLEDLKRDFLTQGAWQILPHTKLLVMFKDTSKIEKQKFSQIEFHAAELNGATLAYKCTRKEELGNHAYHYYYQPEKKAGIYSGTLSAKSNPQNNLLRVYVNKKSPGDFDLSIFPPGGGERHYEKLSKQFDLELSARCYYRLAWERLPSGHKLIYTYVKDQLHLLDIKNPAFTKTLSWIRFDLLRKDTPYHFKASTSDNNSVTYMTQELEGRQYLRETLTNSQKSEVCSYSQGIQGIGYRLSEMVMDGQMQVKVHYYGSSKPFYDRDEKFYRKHPCVDKVQKLEAPTGPNGEMQTLAEFSYEDGRTDVRDAEGALTRYFYHGDQITQIEHFQKDGGLYSILKFVWEDKRLKGKVLCDGENRPVFSKTFFYDTKGNVVEEVLWGQVTGEASHSFGLNGDGSLLGADHIHKWYHYDSWCNITEEVQDGGISYQYSYKAGTDLLARKLSLYEGKILKREFFLYNEDHLLVEEIVDDGNERDLNNLSLVHQRSVKRYERDKLGFIIATNHLYFSSSSGSECLIERHVYEYDCHHQICKDMVYDAHGNYRYTLETEYDDRGHVTSQSTPLGRKNLYRYNSKGQLLESEEVGLLKKIYTYDPMGRMLCCEEVDNENNRKTSFNTYDSKGRITSQTDFLGRTTYQSYDAFGRCIQTQFPETKDESEHVYTPCVDFTYDVSGNLASHTNPRGETTRTEYNVFQKPTLITRADGAKIAEFNFLAHQLVF